MRPLGGPPVRVVVVVARGFAWFMARIALAEPKAAVNPLTSGRSLAGAARCTRPPDAQPGFSSSTSEYGFFAALAFAPVRLAAGFALRPAALLADLVAGRADFVAARAVFRAGFLARFADVAVRAVLRFAMIRHPLWRGPVPRLPR
jgi:hypothetical protein